MTYVPAGVLIQRAHNLVNTKRSASFMVKAELAEYMREIVRCTYNSIECVSQNAGVERTVISNIVGNRYNKMSIDKMIDIMDTLKFKIDISVKPVSINYSTSREFYKKYISTHVYCDATQIAKYYLTRNLKNHPNLTREDVRSVKKWMFVSPEIAEFLRSECEIILDRDGIAHPKLGHLVWGISDKFYYYTSNEKFLDAIRNIIENGGNL